MSRRERSFGGRRMVDRLHSDLSPLRQSALLDISRYSLDYQPRVSSSEELSITKVIEHKVNIAST